MNPWVIVLPCLIHLTAFGTKPTSLRTIWANGISVAMGIVVFVDQTFGLLDWTPIVKHFAIPYLSISVSLNVLLTFMIVARLVLHGRKVRTIMGSPAGVGGLYKTIVAMLIESSALYAATSLLVIGTTFGENSTQVVYFPILVETQVRASPQPRSSGDLSNAMTGRSGHCSVTHHPTSRQQECVDERHHLARDNQFVQG